MVPEIPSCLVPTDDCYMTTPEAAIYLRLAESTLQKLRVTKGGPTFCKLGARVVYRKSSLDEWASQHVCKSTADRPMAMAAA